MKLLLDSCVWGPSRAPLTAHGHDVEWAGAWDRDPGDREILRRALAEGRTMVTLDKDFGELAIVENLPHCGIIRLVGFSARMQVGACLEVIGRYEADLVNGAIVTASPQRLRVRPGGSN